jgi:hypothetical protein
MCMHCPLASAMARQPEPLRSGCNALVIVQWSTHRVVYRVRYVGIRYVHA